MVHCDDCQQRLKIGLTQSHALRNAAKSWDDCYRVPTVPMWPMYEVWVPFPGTMGHNKGWLKFWAGGQAVERPVGGSSWVMPFCHKVYVRIFRNLGFTRMAITSLN